MLGFPKAKINIGLRIIGKRPDGYHNIETIFYPIGLCDALEFIVNPDSRQVADILTITGYELPGPPGENLVLRSLAKLRKFYNVPPLIIHLHKKIPAGAGLGGGSSDAAAMLRMTVRYFRIPLTNAELKSIAGDIGSDCPFFIDCHPSFATGRGEILTPLTCFLDGYYIVIVNPGVHVPTREAYENCILSGPTESPGKLTERPINEWKGSVFNDFEKSLFIRYPVINEAKEALYAAGAIYSSMSGSGSTVFGIFSEEPEITSDLKRLIIYKGKL